MLSISTNILTGRGAMWWRGWPRSWRRSWRPGTMGHTCEFVRSNIEALHSNHLRELERICIIIYLDNSQNLLSWNYIFCMDVRIIINFNTWIWIFNKLKLRMRPSISIEEPTVSFQKLSILHGRENHCHSIWILNKFKL